MPLAARCRTVRFDTRALLLFATEHQATELPPVRPPRWLAARRPDGSDCYADGLKSPNTAPAGSLTIDRRPTPSTSHGSRMTVAPSSLALAVVASISPS